MFQIWITTSLTYFKNFSVHISLEKSFTTEKKSDVYNPVLDLAEITSVLTSLDNPFTTKKKKMEDTTLLGPRSQKIHPFPPCSKTLSSLKKN